MEFWGTVTEVLKGGEDNLPEEDDTKVVRLATAMLIFFIVCILLLLVYLACRQVYSYNTKGSIDVTFYINISQSHYSRCCRI